MTTDGMTFLDDIKFTVMHALYKKGLDFVEAEKIAGNVREVVFSHFQGARFYIPNLKWLDVKARKEQVLACREEGKKISEIARLTGLTVATVYAYIRNRNKIGCDPGRKKADGITTLDEIKLCTAKILLQSKIESATCKAITEEILTFIQKQWGGIAVVLPQIKPIKGTINQIRKTSLREMEVEL